MKDKTSPQQKADDLGRQAQDMLGTRRDKKITGEMSTEEWQRLIKELQIRQIESEIQEEAFCQLKIKFRTLVEQIPAITYIAALDQASTTLFISPQVESMLGFTSAAYLADPDIWRKQLHPDDRDRVLAEVARCHATGEPFSSRYRMLSKEGKVVWFRDDAWLLDDSNGRPLYLQGVMFDITQRQEAEERLHENLCFLETLLETIPNPIFYKDSSGLFLGCNKAFEKFIGLAKEEIVGKSVHQLAPKDLADIYYAMDRELFDSPGRVQAYESKVRHVDGALHEVIFNKAVFLKKDNSVGGLVGVVLDISERKQAEEALRQSEEKYRLLVNQIPAIFFKGYADWSVDFFDRKIETLTGYAKEEFDSRRVKWCDLIHPADLDHIQRIFIEALKTDKSYVREHRITKKNGDICWIQCRGQIFCDDTGQVDYVSGVFFDITPHKKAEQSLQRYAERFSILHKIDQAILSAKSPQAIVEATLCYIRQLLPCQRANIIIFNFEAAEATILGCQGNEGTKLKLGSVLPLDFLSSVKTIQQGEVNLMEDIQALPHKSPLQQILLAEGIRSYINVPLRVKGELVGSLNLGDNNPGAFTIEYGEVVREVADSLAIGLHQAQLYEEIDQQSGQLRALSTQLAEAEEAERRRLARELHDRVGQSLTSLGLNLTYIQTQLSPMCLGKIDSRLEDSQRLLEETMEIIRDVMADLRPEGLDDYGLLAALRCYGERFATRTGLSTLVQGDDLRAHLPVSIETTLFRIAQEALTNVAKHAQATQVKLTLEEKNGCVRLTVVDNGLGLNCQALRSPAKGGWGLITMKERARAMGGKLLIESEPDKGTKVVVEVRS